MCRKRVRNTRPTRPAGGRFPTVFHVTFGILATPFLWIRVLRMEGVGVWEGFCGRARPGHRPRWPAGPSPQAGPPRWSSTTTRKNWSSCMEASCAGIDQQRRSFTVLMGKDLDGVRYAPCRACRLRPESGQRDRKAQSARNRLWAKPGSTPTKLRGVCVKIFWRWVAPPNWFDGAVPAVSVPSRFHGQTSLPVPPGDVP